jgi:hypothetical protein
MVGMILAISSVGVAQEKQVEQDSQALSNEFLANAQGEWKLTERVGDSEFVLVMNINGKTRTLTRFLDGQRISRRVANFEITQVNGLSILTCYFPIDRSGNDRYARYAAGLMTQYDQNKDGKFDSKELAKMRRPPKHADLDGDGFITTQELSDALSGKNRSAPGSPAQPNSGPEPTPPKLSQQDAFRSGSPRSISCVVKIDDGKWYQMQGFLATDKGPPRMTEFTKVKSSRKNSSSRKAKKSTRIVPFFRWLIGLDDDS